MTYESLNNTRKCGEINPMELNKIVSLPSRPSPELWKPFQQIGPKRNKRETLNATTIENTSTALPNIPMLS